MEIHLGLSQDVVHPLRDLSTEESELAVQRFVEESERVRTYRTVVQLWAGAVAGGEPSAPADLGLAVIADVALPDRFHVCQHAGEHDDEWITIGDATWDALGLAVWGPTVRSGVDRSSINNWLLLDGFVDAVRNSQPNTARLCEYGQRRFIQLEFEPVDADVVFGKLADNRGETERMSDSSWKVATLQSEPLGSE